MMRNYPIPDIIGSDTPVRGVQHLEDGQQRITTCWRYFHNLFAYTPTEFYNMPEETKPHIYYNRIPDDAPENSFTLEEIRPAFKQQLDSYRLSVKIIRIDEVHIDQRRGDIISDIFERLNSGKSLADGDKMWNRKETPAVSFALRCSSDEDMASLLKRALNIDIRKIVTSNGRAISKKPICSVVAMVLGFSVPTEGTWADVLTTSFPKISSYLSKEFTNERQIIQGISAICDVLINAPVGDGGRRLSKKENASFNRHLGVMIYNWRTRFPDTSAVISEDDIEMYKADWMGVIEHFQNSPYELDHPEHPITSLYVDGDRKNKNTDIGSNIASRHRQLLLQVPTWNIEFYNE